MEEESPLIMKRSATPAPEGFSSTSGSVLVKSEAVLEVQPISLSVSQAEAEAAEAPSPSHVATSDFESVDSSSRSEVQEVDASPASLI